MELVKISRKAAKRVVSYVEGGAKGRDGTRWIFTGGYGDNRDELKASVFSVAFCEEVTSDE